MVVLYLGRHFVSHKLKSEILRKIENVSWFPI